MITRKEFRKRLENEILILDGGMGTMLQEWGLPTGQAPEAWNLEKSEAIQDVHETYVAAGADIVLTNTFGATRLKLESHGLGKRVAAINRAAVRIARKAASDRILVGLSVGPLGKSLYPLGDLTFEQAFELFAEQVRAVRRVKPDLVVIETMADIREARAAAMAARDSFTGPILVQMTYSEGDATLTGVRPGPACCTLEALDIDAVGANCSLGPVELFPVLQEMAGQTGKPLLVQPNAGLPELRSGKTVFPGSPALLAQWAVRFVELGVNILGGCCGTGPNHITAIRRAVKGMSPVSRPVDGATRLSGRGRIFVIGDGFPVGILGERINPTARKSIRQALERGNFAALRNEAEAQVGEGAAVIDVNVGAAGIDEPAAMRQAVRAVQAAADGPLSLDSSDPKALEQGLMEVEGKPLINSTTAEKEKLDALIPLAKRYGAAIVGLTLDEEGIPRTAERRLALARRIVEAATARGIPESDIFIDPLVLSVATEADQAMAGLNAVRDIKRELGVRVLMGVSNVSHGLPGRPTLNAHYLAMALSAGLDLPIANPFSEETRNVLLTGNLLLGRDPYGKFYLESHESLRRRKPRAKLKRRIKPPDLSERMVEAVLEGDADLLLSLVDDAFEKGWSPMKISDDGLLPSLAALGGKFKSREFFLPQVVLSAQTVQKAFEKVKARMPKDQQPDAGRVVMATVRGDIHEIGKNIVITLLENHGFEVTDLGKNVDADQIVEAAITADADVIGLSALMTTTMLEMPRVVAALRESPCRARVMVGGAVVTREFARKALADGWAPDAMGAVDEAKRLVELARK